MIKLLTVALILFSTSAMAQSIQGQLQRVGVTVDSSTNREVVVNAPHIPPMTLVNNYRWPCGGFSGLGAQGQYMGITAGGTKDSKSCIAWLLSTQESNPERKEAYKCQMEVHRKAMKSIGKPCVKARSWFIPRPTYRD